MGSLIEGRDGATGDELENRPCGPLTVLAEAGG
jgi:hypothetical protein